MLQKEKELLNKDYRIMIYKNVGKRLFDLIVSISAVVLLSPILLLISILIKLDSPGPIIYKQQRVGKNRNEFCIFKFRTMVDDADKIGPRSTASEDKRITHIGNKLRKLSLDELPQMFNVLFGDMSIVGPRPDLYEHLSLFTPEHISLRLSVKPGITGLAQINGRSSISMDDRVYFDEKYVNNITFLNDMKIIVSTFLLVLRRKGVN